MVIVMKPGADNSSVKEITNIIEAKNIKAHVFYGEERNVIGLIGDTSLLKGHDFEVYENVERVLKIKESYKLANRNFNPNSTIIDVNGIKIGGEEIVIMAGPCSVENREQIIQTAKAVKKAGAQFLRGGAFKPRTSPYGFQGLGEEGLKLLKEAKEETGLSIISEITSEELIELAEKYIDIIQIGARNVQNFKLLKELGKTSKPVMLKRGMATNIEEWLNSAEYIMSEGNSNVILCERGIRTFETATRNTLDICAVPVLKNLTHLPVIVDPSHAAGRSTYVSSLAKAGIAAGADGLIIEVHPNPKQALSDAAQQLTFEEFNELNQKLKQIALAVDRKVF